MQIAVYCHGREFVRLLHDNETPRKLYGKDPVAVRPFPITNPDIEATIVALSRTDTGKEDGLGSVLESLLSQLVYEGRTIEVEHEK